MTHRIDSSAFLHPVIEAIRHVDRRPVSAGAAIEAARHARVIGTTTGEA